MKKKTVRRKILICNALTVLVTLVLLAALNVGFVKLYTETVEKEWESSIGNVLGEDQVEELLADFTIHKHSFRVLFAADGLLCAGILILVSFGFTRHLASHICTPLGKLTEGAVRIRQNDLTQDIVYTGEEEFEELCQTFNEMQSHLLSEQERNLRYERARTDMIAGISHDLKTPLTAIRGTIKALQDGIVSTPEQRDKFLETAYRRTGDMDVLLNQLFYVSKLETGNMPLSMRRMEMGAFVQSYVLAKQKLLEGEEVTFMADTEEGEAWAEADPDQLCRIFDNLLENSRKYGETEPLAIRLSVKRKEKWVSLCFADNGAGIAEDKLPHLFEEFYRGDESRNRKEGSGLGLYIVKCLIEGMNGRVHAESKDGFAIYMELPIKE